MKNILITGIDSYIGTSFENWLKKEPDHYHVDTIDMREDSWKKMDFSKYEVVFHVAGIAHVSTKANMEQLYYKVNRNLAIETAKKAKDEGVKQFIFMSSIIVYGKTNVTNGIITKDTIPKPDNFYGKSKLQAEEGIQQLANKDFNIAILRPPMIYGKGSKGNYPKLSKMSKKIPIFPEYDNKRSMLHIDNLCEFIKLIIDNDDNGLFFPQNKDYVKTSDMVKMIAEVNNKKIKLIKILNHIIKTLINRVGMINKVFGDLVYEKSMSSYHHIYQIRDLKESIELTEKEILSEHY